MIRSSRPRADSMTPRVSALASTLARNVIDAVRARICVRSGASRCRLGHVPTANAAKVSANKASVIATDAGEGGRPGLPASQACELADAAAAIMAAHVQR